MPKEGSPTSDGLNANLEYILNMLEGMRRFSPQQPQTAEQATRARHTISAINSQLSELAGDLDPR